MRLLASRIGKFCVVLCGTLASSQAVQAHPGHAVEVVPNASALHYVLQPEHLGGALLLTAAVVIGVVKLLHERRRRSKRQLARVRKHS